MPAKHSGLLNYGSHYHLSCSEMHIDPEECRRLAASCKRLAKTAPSSFLAAKLGELGNKWLDVAHELNEVQIAVQRYKDGEKKTA